MKREFHGVRVRLRARWRTIGPGATVKSFAVGLLAFCFLIDPFGGNFPWLHLQKAMVKNEVRKHIIHGFEDDQLVVLHFSKEETEMKLRWEDPGEFEYDGQMYDVVETWTVGGTVYYRCFWDREETRLNNQLRELAARALAGTSEIGQPPDPWSASSKMLFCAGTSPATIFTPGSSPQRAWAFSDSYSSIIIVPPTPPPRRA